MKMKFTGLQAPQFHLAGQRGGKSGDHPGADTAPAALIETDLWRSRGYLDEESIRRLLAELIPLLRNLHSQGKTHGRLSPENVLVKERGWVLAPILDGDIDEDVLFGNVPDGYAAFELYVDRADGPLGPWTDVYGLSALAYTLITGAAPPDAVRRSVLDACEPLGIQEIPGYSPALLGAIDRGLSLAPPDRQATVDEFAMDAGVTRLPTRRRAGSAEGVSVGSVPAAALRERRKAPVWLMGGVVAMAGAGALWAWQGRGDIAAGPAYTAASGQPAGGARPVTAMASTEAAPGASSATGAGTATGEAREYSAADAGQGSQDSYMTARTGQADAARMPRSMASGASGDPAATAHALAGTESRDGLRSAQAAENTVMASPRSPDDALLAAGAGQAASSAGAGFSEGLPVAGAPAVPAAAQTDAAQRGPGNNAGTDAYVGGAVTYSQGTKTAGAGTAAVTGTAVDGSMAGEAEAGSGKAVAAPRAAAAEPGRTSSRAVNVAVNVRPWGEVFINGSSRGVSPPLRSLSLRPGTYRVKITNGQLPPLTSTVTVKRGEPVTIAHDFRGGD